MDSYGTHGPDSHSRWADTQAMKAGRLTAEQERLAELAARDDSVMAALVGQVVAQIHAECQAALDAALERFGAPAPTGEPGRRPHPTDGDPRKAGPA